MIEVLILATLCILFHHSQFMGLEFNHRDQLLDLNVYLLSQK